ncbi:hypothetical protein RchiOBHm_Chr7g0236251 [Rosa chinensis]|uniref:Uncharacterized protein n=1 Tax=Rosa chinensis TaxID=74649 RepID=A0A2P6PGV6_ROSCH|nr:hypothetical protein RchiOBHm_Chr7g0236251 [Rosa chinensis]
MRLVRNGAISVRKMKCLKKQKRDVEKKKKRAHQIQREMFSLDELLLEFDDQQFDDLELFFSVDELVRDTDNPAVDDDQLHKEEEEECINMFMACVDQWVANDDPTDA